MSGFRTRNLEQYIIYGGQMISKERTDRIMETDWVEKIIDCNQTTTTVQCTKGHVVEVLTKSLTRADNLKHCPQCKKEKRKENLKNCLNCGKQLKVGQEKFCSNSCSATYNNALKREKIEKRKCKNCGTEIDISKSYGKVYCSDECRTEHKHLLKQIRYQEILNGRVEIDCKSGRVSKKVRGSLISKYNNSCQKCGWNEVNKFTGKVPLQIHHIDGNPENNELSNLEVLCPNCHALTKSFGNKNFGKGRESRRLYRLKNKTNN